MWTHSRGTTSSLVTSAATRSTPSTSSAAVPRSTCFLCFDLAHNIGVNRPLCGFHVSDFYECAIVSGWCSCSAHGKCALEGCPLTGSFWLDDLVLRESG